MRRRLVKIALTMAVASAIASALNALRRGAPSRGADATTPGSLDTWPEVPKNPGGPTP